MNGMGRMGRIDMAGVYRSGRVPEDFRVVPDPGTH